MNEDDPDRRSQFCETMKNMLQMNHLLLNNVLFTDEASFYLNGTVNRQNCRYWTTTNQHWFIEHKTQYQQKVNVWAGIIHNRIIGPYYLDGILTGPRYLLFLQTEVIPRLTELFSNAENTNIPADTLWFQQDEAPPHFAQPVREYLNYVFANRWIGRRGEVEWPARSPDLSPLDFFLLGHVKNEVYKEKPNDVEHLKDKITTVIRSITPEVIHSAIQEFEARLVYCQEVNGEGALRTVIEIQMIFVTSCFSTFYNVFIIIF